MDIISQTYKAYQTIIELLDDRNYIVPAEYKELKDKDFKYLFLNNNIELFIDQHQSNNKKCFIKFILINKAKPNIVRDIITKVKKTYSLGTNDEMILVLKSCPNNSIIKITKESQYSICQILWLDILQFNITHHELVPKHVLLNKEEENNLFNTYSIKNKYQLPIIDRSDPVVKYYNFKPGDVIKILRSSQTSGEINFYRCIK